MIEVRQLCYRFAEREILQHINFSLASGEFWLVCGPNGAGKTTLLKILAGLIRGYDGQVLLEGRELKTCLRRALAKRVVYLAQEADLAFSFPVRDILATGRYPYQHFLLAESPADRKAIAAVTEQLHLESFLERDILTLSGGERKKVLLATALIQDAPLLLLDEPLNFLDPAEAVQVLRMLTDFHAWGKTVVVVSHQIEYFFPLAEKMLVLRNGHQVYGGAKHFSPDLFREAYGVSFGKLSHMGKELLFLDV